MSYPNKFILKLIQAIINLTSEYEMWGRLYFESGVLCDSLSTGVALEEGSCLYFSLPPALLNMAALWAPPWLYRRIAQERKKSTALQRVRFSHFFLRIRHRQNRYRIGRRGPGYRLILCCRTATKTGKGWERERWFLEIPYGARLAHRWADMFYYEHNRSSDCVRAVVPVPSLTSVDWETSFYLGYYLEIAEDLVVSQPRELST